MLLRSILGLFVLASGAIAQQQTTLREVKVPQLTPVIVVMPFSADAHHKRTAQQVFLAQDLIFEHVLLAKRGTPLNFELQRFPPAGGGRGGSLDLFVNSMITTEGGDPLPVAGSRLVKGIDFSSDDSWTSCEMPFFCLPGWLAFQLVPGFPGKFGSAMLFTVYVQQDVLVKGVTPPAAPDCTGCSSARIHLYTSFKTKLNLDGEPLGNLRKHSYACLLLKPGDHTLSTGDSEMKFFVAAGEERYFKIFDSTSGRFLSETSGYELGADLTQTTVERQPTVDCFAPIDQLEPKNCYP